MTFQVTTMAKGSTPKASGTPTMDSFDPTLRHVVGTLLGGQEGDTLVDALKHHDIHTVDGLVTTDFVFEADALDIPSRNVNNRPFASPSTRPTKSKP